MKTKYIDITPHRSIMLKLGQSGYLINEALAELVDNSLDAKIEDQKLVVKIILSPDQIRVEDNAEGMDEELAAQSIRLGFSQKKNQLGMFGLGLKTACSSLGKKFEIITTQADSKEIYSLVYEEEAWLENGSWTNFPLMVKDKLNEFEPPNGTTIIVSKLMVEVNTKVIQKVKEEFSKRFSPFLEAGEMELIINQDKVLPYNFTLTKEGKKEINLNLPSGTVIKGWFGFKFKDEMGDYYGFNTYRKNRLISTYDKFCLTRNQKDKQIVGELHLDQVPVTHNKRDWIRESEEFKVVKQALINYMKDYDIKMRPIISGLPAHPGRVEGIARVLNLGSSTPIEAINCIKSGDIIVTEMTRPQFLLQLQKVAAIVTDQGGMLCHAAILSREFGIPAVVGTRNATEKIRDGQRIIVDAHTGVIYDGE